MKFCIAANNTCTEYTSGLKRGIYTCSHMAGSANMLRWDNSSHNLNTFFIHLHCTNPTESVYLNNMHSVSILWLKILTCRYIHIMFFYIHVECMCVCVHAPEFLTILQYWPQCCT